MGYTDVKFVGADKFDQMIDKPRFYETMGLGSQCSTGSSSDSDTEVKTGPHVAWGSNSDQVSVGQLLLEFFEFYGFNFENEKLAIDIRHADESNGNSPFRPRLDFIREAHSELDKQAQGKASLPYLPLFHAH